jgi:hypothetical protein
MAAVVAVGLVDLHALVTGVETSVEVQRAPGQARVELDHAHLLDDVTGAPARCRVLAVEGIVVVLQLGKLGAGVGPVHEDTPVVKDVLQGDPGQLQLDAVTRLGLGRLHAGPPQRDAAVKAGEIWPAWRLGRSRLDGSTLERHRMVLGRALWAGLGEKQSRHGDQAGPGARAEKWG